MLTRKLCCFYRRGLNKYLSSLPLNKIESSTSDTDATKEKEKSILQSPDYFNVHDLFTVKDLFDARVHYGHKITSLNDKMKPFIFGSRLGHIVFDLNITAFHLREALNFAAHIAYRDGIILFVSKNPMVTLLVEKTAFECKEYSVTREWRLGVFSDAKNIFGCITRLPDLCIILNTKLENGTQHLAVSEAARMCIPTIGIVDSNCDPNIITYPVPGNDDSYSSISLYCNLFKQAILRGKNERIKHIPQQQILKTLSTDNDTQSKTDVVKSVEQSKAEVQKNEVESKEKDIASKVMQMKLDVKES